jgi:cytoskeletal protein CcmA (bactofilin family)
MARIVKNDPPRMMKNLPDACIPSGTMFTGNINTMGGVRIDGTVKGNVKAGGDITIGIDGAVDGSVTAYNVNIAGAINGNLTSSGTVQMLSGAKLTGNLSAFSFAIEQGAYYMGKCTITDNTEQALLSAPADDKKHESKKKDTEKPVEKAAEKAAEKVAEKPVEIPIKKPAEKTA